VDGLDRVEAVIVRRIGTGRLIGVNASAIHVFAAADGASSVGTEKGDPTAIEYAPNLRCARRRESINRHSASRSHPRRMRIRS
jgi:hypothetical protein